MKVVINSCFGGFSLSPKATKRLAELQGKECYFFKWNINPNSHTLVEEKELKGLFWTAFSVPNPDDVLPKTERGKDGTYLEYNQAYEKIKIESRDLNRSDPLLIQVVEELGEEANGSCAELKIVEIPDGIEWEIDEYDGNESVEEVHRSWP